MPSQVEVGDFNTEEPYQSRILRYTSTREILYLAFWACDTGEVSR